MAEWSNIIPDIIFCPLYIYLLIRLATASDTYFKTPFYTFFIITGIYSVVGIVAYHAAVNIQLLYSSNQWTIHVYKMASALNTFGALGATIGKTFIAFHRYYVLRSQDFYERKLATSTIRLLFGFQFTVSLLMMVPVWWRFNYVNLDSHGQIVVISDFNQIIGKAISVGSYVLYIVCNIVCTSITSRRIFQLMKNIGNIASYQAIVKRQRNMFIVVTVCSFGHFVKALQATGLAVSTYFELASLYYYIYGLYPLANGLASYAAPFCLVALTPKVRARLRPCGNRIAPYNGE